MNEGGDRLEIAQTVIYNNRMDEINQNKVMLRFAKKFLYLGILSLALLAPIQSSAQNPEEESYKYLSQTTEYKILIANLKKKEIAFHHILGSDSKSGLVTIELREEKEDHTARLEMFLYDPRTKKCFIQNSADLTLKQIK